MVSSLLLGAHPWVALALTGAGRVTEGRHHLAGSCRRHCQYSQQHQFAASEGQLGAGREMTHFSCGNL